MDDIMWFDIIIYAVGAKCEHGIGYRKIIIKQFYDNTNTFLNEKVICY